MKKFYLSCIIVICTTPSFAQIFANSVVSCSSSGVCIGGSSCDNSGNAVDAGDLTNFGTLSTGIGVACSRMLVLSLPVSQSAGSYVGFQVNTYNVASVLGNLSITTFNAGTPVETVSGASLISLLTSGKGVVQFKTTAGPFDQIAISMGAVVGVAQTLDVYYGFTNATLLPVQFASFGYSKTTDGLLLQWAMSNEALGYFVVEQSADGIGFTEAGKVESKNINGQYQYTIAAESRLMYYRIKQVSANGSVVYSTTIVIKANKANLSVWIYPNPVKRDDLQLDIYSSTVSLASIHVFDQQGREVLVQTNKVNAGNTVIAIDTEKLAPGMYVLRTGCNGTVSSTKFLKVK